MNGIATDLAFDRGIPHYAVVWAGQLLPVRFTKKGEARRHLSELLAVERAPAVSPDRQGPIPEPVAEAHA